MMMMKMSFLYPKQYSFIYGVLMLEGPSKCLKQIIDMKLNMVKNSIWLQTNYLTICKRGRDNNNNNLTTFIISPNTEFYMFW